MKVDPKRKRITDPPRGLDLVLPLDESEIGLLGAADPENAANDNAPLLEVAQGVVWRDVLALQRQAGAADEGPLKASRDDMRELDFGASRSGPRGFLEEG